MNAPRLARVAGALYLVLALLGVFAQLVVRAAVHVPGDAGATAQNIVAYPTLFRFGLVADVMMATAFVCVGIALYRLLEHVDRSAAAAMMIFVSVGAGMILVNLVFHHAALLVATDVSYAAAVGVEGSDALIQLLVDMHHHGYVLGGVFFGLWLLPLGYLAHRSGYFPRALGVLLMVASVSYLIDTVATFLAPDLSAIAHEIITAPTYAEFWLILYLLIKGVRSVRPDERVPVAA